MSYPPNPSGEPEPTYSSPPTDPYYGQQQPAYPPTNPQGWPAQPGTTAQQPVFDPGQTPVYDPNSGQPVYSAPTAQQPAYPAYTQPQASGGSKAPLWIALGIVLLLLIGGGATAAVLLAGKNDKKASSSPTTPGPVQTTSSAPTQGPPASTITLTTPQSVGDYSLATDPAFTGLADQAKSGLSGLGASTTDTIAAAYQNSGDATKLALVIAATAPLSNPDAELDALFTGFAQGLGSSPTDVHEVDAGPLGGKAKCANATSSGQDMLVCGWVDDGSLGVVVMFNTESSEGEGVFLDFRSAVESK